MRYIRRSLSIIFVFLIGSWVLIASLRTVYNISKLFTEEKQWFFLSNEEKKEMAYGDLHTFYRFVEHHTPLSAKILFLSSGAKAYYLGRYYLYPRRIIFAKSPDEVYKILQREKFDFLLVYQTEDKSLDEHNSSSWNINNFTPTATHSGDISAKGTIYKL